MAQTCTCYGTFWCMTFKPFLEVVVDHKKACIWIPICYHYHIYCPLSDSRRVTLLNLYYNHFYVGQNKHRPHSLPDAKSGSGVVQLQRSLFWRPFPGGHVPQFEDNISSIHCTNEFHNAPIKFNKLISIEDASSGSCWSGSYPRMGWMFTSKGTPIRSMMTEKLLFKWKTAQSHNDKETFAKS